jgi:hypothetical protein
MPVYTFSGQEVRGTGPLGFVTTDDVIRAQLADVAGGAVLSATNGPGGLLGVVVTAEQLARQHQPAVIQGGATMAMQTADP